MAHSLLRGAALLATGLMAGGYAWAGNAVVTNEWINPAGGYWLEGANWKDGKVCGAGAVASVRIKDQAALRLRDKEYAHCAGLCFAPYVSDESDAEPYVSTGWDTWLLRADTGTARYTFSTGLLGYFPISVNDGTLVFGSDFYPVADGEGPVRKEGNGTFRISKFYKGPGARRQLQVAGGTVHPMVWDALMHTDVRVTDPDAHFLPTNFTRRIAIGSYRSAGGPVDFAGNEVLLGATGTDVYPDNFTGKGGVTAVTKNLVVTNIAPGVVYGAECGRLRLDSQTGVAIPFAKYDFEESLTKDSSGHGRNLKAEGAVTLVMDPDRGWVAHFNGTASSGGKLTATVTGTTELTGDSDYTISLWAKTTATSVANDYPTLAAIGTGVEPKDHRVVQFRFQDKNCSQLLLGHWNSRGDFTNLDLPSGVTASSWHHYVAMREGHRLGVWVDGVRIFDNVDTKLEMDLPKTVQLSFGWLPSFSDRFFCGDLDDIRVYSRAVGPAGVERLFAGEEPCQDGPLPAAGSPLTIPGDTKLRLVRNGRIQLAGEQALPVTNLICNTTRASIDMPTGGKLSLSGTGTYLSGFSGAAAFAKTGTGRLTVSGALTQTGGTSVEAGTLAVQNFATQPEVFAIYDFEDPDMFGREVTGSGRNLDDANETKNVTRVWDAERDSWVMRFPGTTAQRLGKKITSPVLSGDTDYTVSVWAKPAADCPDKGCLVSIGAQANFQEIVFRYQGKVSDGKFVLTHWGTTLDFTEIPTEKDPQGKWHHYVATRKGSHYEVFYDGAKVWETTKSQKLNIGESKSVTVGYQLAQTGERFFKGDIDDVRVYTRALDAADVARLYARKDPAGAVRGEAPDALANVPAPVLHYSFEDAKNLGRDSAPGANHLTKMGGGTFSQVDSPLGGKALKFDTYNQTYLKSTAFPEAIPSNGHPFTVSMWVQGSPADTPTSVDGSGHHPTFMCWGNPTEKTIGFMLSYRHEPELYDCVPRLYVRGENNKNTYETSGANTLPGMRDGDPDLRWHHYAVTYSKGRGISTYIDGIRVDDLCRNTVFTNDSCRSGGVFYLGAKSTALAAPFRGALDEVRVFDRELNIPQIRAVMRADMGGVHVLPKGGALSVAAGATLEVNGTDETASTVAGEGTLDFISGRLTLTGASSFAGTLKGEGTVVLPAGASLTLGTDPQDFTGYVEMAGGAFGLPAGVTAIPATFRMTAIDPSAETAVPGDAEIPDGTALAATAEFHGPFVTAAGKVIVAGSGTITLPAGSVAGRTWVIARGASVEDLGTGDLNERWTVTNLRKNHSAEFKVQNGEFTCTVSGPGVVLLVR